jgi:flavodoxin I
MKTGVFYSTTTGNTETIAGYINAAAPGAEEAVDISEVDDLSGYDSIIVGAPTWHTGADKERSGTSWDEWLYDVLPGLGYKGKVAIFGVGDSLSYAENYVDAAGEIFDCFTAGGATCVGAVSTDGYDHVDSKAVRDGKFVGMMFDEDNQYDLSESRAGAWVEQLKGEGFAL